MRLYWEIARVSFLRFSAYRAATIAGVLTNSAFGFLRAYIFIAAYQESAVLAGYTLQDALTYTWLTQAMIMTVYMWGWWEIADTIRSGDIVTDFQRPVDYQFYWLAQDLGRACYHLLARGIPPVVLGGLFFDLAMPRNPLTWLALPVSIALAVTISFAVRFMINLSGFWMVEVRGLGGIMAALLTVLSGFLIPLAYFPEPWRSITQALPFAGVIGIPIDIYLEKAHGLNLLAALTFQAAWAVALLAVGRLQLARALRRVEVQGG
ncbi:MAG: ABC-2 family transporter protein [Chloroflexi bacterium]|nr:ABC-2 family transporter protein [Chloroflexota bacterium]